MKSPKRLHYSQALILCWILFSPIAAWPIQVQAENLMKGPNTFPSDIYHPPYYQTSAVKLVWKNAIDFYARFISPADGPRSPSYPTSTAYGKQAIEQYGFAVGIILIADRLFHEADLPLGPKIYIYGSSRFYDPLANNTFWWDQKQKLQPPENLGKKQD